MLQIIQLFYYYGYGENDVKEQFLKAKIFDGKSFWEAEKNWHGMMNHKYKKMIFVNCGLKKPYHVQKAKKYFFGVWRNENGVVVMRFLTIDALFKCSLFDYYNCKEIWKAGLHPAF